MAEVFIKEHDDQDVAKPAEATREPQRSRPGMAVEWERAADDSGEARLMITGVLNTQTLATGWSRVQEAVDSRPPSTVDVSGVTDCDGAGIAMLAWLDQRADPSRGVTLSGVPERWAALIQTIANAPAPDHQQRPQGMATQIGHNTAAIVKDMAKQIAFVGEAFLALAWAVRNPQRVRWKDVFVIAEKVGVNAVPVVSLLGFLMGLIIAFQAAIPMATMGFESMIPMIVGIAMVRELGPLMTAILLAGRSGSAFAAEIGTMKVTEEINALNTFGLDPARFLVVPRILAALVMTPLLSLFATVMGIIGGYVVMAGLGYSAGFYRQQILFSVDYLDLLQGVFKAGVFALLVAGIGCLRGLNTQVGPGAVGDSTTRSVVAGIVWIVIADGVLGVVFYYMGI